MRILLSLECEECKRRNYTTTKNKQKHPDKVLFKKFCPWCNKHTNHKETKA
ncbi:MAG: 50S ribosomal protein L33 [bacterium]|nr:50S ribosomal protein L33 [bacterium]